jgi:Sortase domain
MTGDHTRPANGRRDLLATVVASLLALAGVVCIGIAVTDQQYASQPPLSTGGSLGPSAPGVAADSSAPAAPKAVARVVGPVLPASAPVALNIPAIGVDSQLQSLGQNADGSMQVPAPGSRHYDEAGWYRYSPTPGSLGPAVIVGHLDSVSGPSVFFRLGSLQAGDTVLVRRADGTVAVFAVDEVRRYHKSSFPTQIVYGDTDHAALRLITCGGPIDPRTGHYRDNIVVLASLVRGIGATPQTCGPSLTRCTGTSSSGRSGRTETTTSTR